MTMAVDGMGDRDISNLRLPDRGLKHGVHAEFNPRNSFIVYGTHRTSKIAGSVANQYLHEITPRAALYNDYVRKLINETHSIFLSFNSKIEKYQEDLRRTEIVRVSQQYRSVLLACVEEIHEATQSSNDEELLDLLQMFSDIELLWNLLHTLILDAPSGTRVLYKLLDWIKWHFVFAQKKREEIIQTDEPSSHPEYWDTIFQFLLQGHVLPARSLLSMHKKCKREEFTSLDELLKKMPFYGSNCGVSLNEFRIRWKLWQDECRARLERGEYSHEENLEKICRLLCGDFEILTEKSYLCKNWYHIMISVLFYTNPCINVSDLADTARTYYNNVTCDSSNKSNLVDSVILAAMELDIKNIISLICSFNDGWWFAAHIMDLLYHGDFFEHNTRDSDTKNYRKFLLNNYAENLMSHPSLWQVGIDYLDECKASCELYLERIPLKTEAQARKIIYLARKRNMDNLVKTVANIMTAKSIGNGKLGTALTWVMHSKDTRYADEIADRWLQNYTDQRMLEGVEIFRNMGSCMLVSDKLTFVGKYCEFHKLYEDRDLKNAASLLISLVASGLAPPNFQMIMLLDSLPLLEVSELIFTQKDTHQLMECLEETLKCSDTKSIADTSEQENIIRLALVRNLARCFVIDTGNSDSEDDQIH